MNYEGGRQKWNSYSSFILPISSLPQPLDSSSIFTYINKIIIVQRFHVQRSRLKKGLQPE
jgi:hypothetical protein